jgi:hypothetical protein
MSTAMTALRAAKFFRDVNVVEQYAKCIIYITKDRIEIRENPNYRIEMLVVIGPYRDERYDLPNAVLLEIGLKRTKPYSTSEGLKDDSWDGPKTFRERHSHLSMTTEQYQLVGPAIFEYLKQYAEERVLMWLHDWYDPRWIKIPVAEHKHFGVTRDFKWYSVEPSIRFSISVQDSFMVSDVYWAELNGKYDFEFRIKKLLAYMYRRLGGFKTRGRKYWPRNWMKYRRFAEAISALQKLPWYLQVYVWKTHFPKSDPFHYEIMEQIKYEGVDPWEEAVRNAVLPNPAERLGDNALRIVRRDSKYVVFEIFPPPPVVVEELDLEK